MLRERGDVLLGVLFVLGAVLTAAAASPSVLNVGDDVANRVILYSTAIGIGLAVWRKGFRPVLRTVKGYDARLKRIERHLGIPEAFADDDAAA